MYMFSHTLHFNNISLKIRVIHQSVVCQKTGSETRLETSFKLFSNQKLGLEISTRTDIDKFRKNCLWYWFSHILANRKPKHRPSSCTMVTWPYCLLSQQSASPKFFLLFPVRNAFCQLWIQLHVMKTFAICECKCCPMQALPPISQSY